MKGDEPDVRNNITTISTPWLSIPSGAKTPSM
jgi:hypothetical protein